MSTAGMHSRQELSRDTGCLLPGKTTTCTRQRDNTCNLFFFRYFSPIPHLVLYYSLAVLPGSRVVIGHLSAPTSVSCKYFTEHVPRQNQNQKGTHTVPIFFPKSYAELRSERLGGNPAARQGKEATISRNGSASAKKSTYVRALQDPTPTPTIRS